MATDQREAFIGGLRELADALESRQDIPLPSFQGFAASVPDAEAMAKAAKALPGRVRKQQLGSGMVLLADFGPLSYTLTAQNVCERVQTGTRIMRRRKRRTEELGYERVEVPVYEWKCPPSLLNGGSGE